MDSFAIVLAALIASAFFSGMEIAFITSNKLRIELENKQGSISARIFSYFSKYPSRYLGCMLLGNNIALVIFGIFMENILEPLFVPYIHSGVLLLLTQTLVATIIILFTAEFLPKNIFRINPNAAINIFAIPVWIIYCLLYPFVFLTTGLSELILKKIFRVKLSDASPSFGRVDLDNYVREATSHKNEHNEIDHEVKIFKKALDFSSIKVRECMVPRTEIVALAVTDSIEKLKNRFIKTRLSKILVYENNIDNIIGYTHSYELFKNPASIRSILLPVAVVPESMPASEALTTFIRHNKSVAVVVDEFGGTSGMLTMEDVMEEIFGEIEDEHDKEELVEKRVGVGEFIFSGRLEIDYLNDKYKLQLPVSEDYTTLSGLLTFYHESIPDLNELITVGGYLFRVTEVSGTRIEQVNVKQNPETA